MSRTRGIVTAAAAFAALAVMLPASSSSARAAWTTTVVASGLDSPRGLAFAADKTLYVAEGGHGGSACNIRRGVPFCIGTTSRISRIDTTSGTVTPVVTGLYSRAVPNEGVTGVSGITAAGGHLMAVETSYPQELDGFDCTGQAPDCAAALTAARAQSGQLLTFTPGGTWKAVSAVGSENYDWSKTDTSLTRVPPNANPYGVYAVAAGAYVADAGANVLNFVSANGTRTIISGIPLPPAGGFPGDGVPTCLTMVHGNLYAADLAGRLWKRNGSYTPTAAPVVDATGTPLLHHVTGCDSDEAGDIYLVDMWGRPGPPIPAGPASVAGTGSVIRVARDGSASVVASGLNFPNGIAVASDGSLYVTTNSTCTAAGTPLPFCGSGGQLVHLTQG